MQPELIEYWCAGGLVLFSVMVLSKPRLPAVFRLFSISSLFLAGLLGVNAWMHSDVHAAYVAGLTVALKVIAIPMLLMWVARRSGASFQVKFLTRPALSYFLVLFALLGAAGGAMLLPVGEGFSERLFVFIGVSLIMLGLVMLCVRRDVYSQIIGFLILENGLTAFASMAVGGLPLYIEIGMTAVIMIGALLMAALSHDIQLAHQSADTHNLRELTD